MEHNKANTQNKRVELSDPYGYELILDLSGCDVNSFNRESIDEYFTQLCERIEMEKCEVHFWDDVGIPYEQQQTDPKTKGTSAVCFILTSTIVIHTLDLLGSTYVNIFSCKHFDADAAVAFTQNWFSAAKCDKTLIVRR